MLIVCCSLTLYNLFHTAAATEELQCAKHFLGKPWAELGDLIPEPKIQAGNNANVYIYLFIDDFLIIAKRCFQKDQIGCSEIQDNTSINQSE